MYGRKFQVVSFLPRSPGQTDKHQSITLKLSGKVIPNRIYRTPFSEYASTYDQNDIEKTGIPKPQYVELYQGKAPPNLTVFTKLSGYLTSHSS